MGEYLKKKQRWTSKHTVLKNPCLEEKLETSNQNQLSAVIHKDKNTNIIETVEYSDPHVMISPCHSDN